MEFKKKVLTPLRTKYSRESSKTPMDPKLSADNDYHCSLLDKIAIGNEAVFSEFYRLFEPRIYAFAKIRLNDLDEASDLLNEVMWEVWRGAGGFKGQSSVTTWVFGIAHHKVLDRLRRRGKGEMEELDSVIAEDLDQDLDEIVTQKQMGEHLLRCMEKLTDVHRKVVHLAFFEDFSYREIGEIVGSPEGTIKARMFHAKQALKRCLARRIK